MPDMNIFMTPELIKIVQDKVASGLYNDVSEVVGVGVRLLFELDAIKKRQIESLNLEIDKGIDSLKSGKFFSGQDVYNELLARRENYAQ